MLEVNAASVSSHDRGLLYGDGVWETILIKQGKAQLLDAHWQRLVRGVKALRMEGVNLPALKHSVQQTCLSHDLAVLKVIITRGDGVRGYNPVGLNKPRYLVQISDVPQFPESYTQDGIVLGLCEYTRLAYQPLLAGFKHLNRLEQVLARSEFEADWQEALVMDYDDFIIEGTMSNVFVVNQDNVLLTPTLKHTGIEGVMRNQVLLSAEQMGIRTQERPLTLIDIQQATSVFMTNSLIGIWPVKRWGHVEYRIHPLVRQLQSTIKAFSL